MSTDSNQKTPEAKNSPQEENPKTLASFSVISPGGFPLKITISKPTSQELLSSIQVLDQYLLAVGYQPPSPQSARQSKPQPETVPNRACPLCGNPLVYFLAKGKKYIKCSTQKYYGGQEHGCSFIDKDETGKWKEAI